MKFNTANDAMEYIKENELYDIPVEVLFCLDKQSEEDFVRDMRVD